MTKEEKPIEKIKKKQKEITYKRIGKCQPNKCGSICCRLGNCTRIIPRKHYKSKKEYEDELRFSKYVGLQIILRTKKETVFTSNLSCIKLKCNKCTVNKTKPETCKLFPQSPNQEYYKICKNLGCTYKFKKIIKVKNV